MKRLSIILLVGAMCIINLAQALPGEDQAALQTQALIAQEKKFEKAQGLDKAGQLEKLIEIAEQRQAHLSELMESDPAALFRVYIPEDHSSGMPDEIQGLLLQEVEVEGTLEELYEDYEDGSFKLRRFLITPAEERFELFVKGEEPLGNGDTDVQVKGLMIASNKSSSSVIGSIALQSQESITTLGCCSVEELSNTPPAGAYTFGEQTTLVLLVNFADNQQTPWTVSTADDVVFGQVSDFFLENSFDQTWAKGEVHGWYTLPDNSTSCDYYSIRINALNAAAADGINTNAFKRIVIAFPRISACTWAGLGTVGGASSTAWLNGYMRSLVISHEMGHNLGLGHSGSMDCGSSTLGNNCSVSTYGNPFDTMGNANNGHYNAFQKERLGWLASNDTHNIVEVGSDGNYDLDPYSLNQSGNKALKIYKGTNSSGKDEFYYVEFRQAVGYDGFIDDSNNIVDEANVLNGVLITQGVLTDHSSSRLLDMTPNTMGSWDMYDAALSIGNTFTDSSANVSIFTAAVGSGGASVNVNLGNPTCVTADPGISISPATSPWLAAGSAYSYTVTVTNNNSAACSSAAFSLSAPVSSGWNAVFGKSSLTMVSGASSSTTVQVTSPSNAVDGFYDIDVSAVNGSKSGKDTLTYVVSNPVNTAPNAVDDAAETTSGTAINIAVLSNDFDPDGDNLTVLSTSNANGNAVINSNGVITYTPLTSYSGTDSFSYVISDGKGGSDSAIVTVTVDAVNTNSPPLAVDDLATMLFIGPITFNVLENDSDPDGDSLSVINITQGKKGQVTYSADGVVSYTPARSFKGNDYFTYTITDGENSATATVTIQLDRSILGGGGGKGNGKGNK